MSRSMQKTAKIKNIVDTFMHKLDEVGCFEKTKQELAKNREDGERIARQIETIRKRLTMLSLHNSSEPQLMMQ